MDKLSCSLDKGWKLSSPEWNNSYWWIQTHKLIFRAVQCFLSPSLLKILSSKTFLWGPPGNNSLLGTNVFSAIVMYSLFGTHTFCLKFWKILFQYFFYFFLFWTIASGRVVSLLAPLSSLFHFPQVSEGLHWYFATNLLRRNSFRDCCRSNLCICTRNVTGKLENKI